MESFPWWSEEQRNLAVEIEALAEKLIPRAEEAWWKREFPSDIYDQIAEKGYFGVSVPKEYGGMGLGATGTSIVIEGMSCVPGIIYVLGGSMMGGLHQIIEFGSEEQKKRFLPRIVKGELGVISITEPFVGTDASAIETVARREGDYYILFGKKRFNTGIGVGRRHMLYARTNDAPEAVSRYRHLTGFVVEKGMPGFTVEKVNEVIGFDNTPNGYLNLDGVRVPVENRIGEEGEGWRVMTSGLNFERTIISASTLGIYRTALRTVVGYAQRRIQFGKPTIDLVNNQFKIADLLTNLKLARLATFYAAYLFDLGQEATVESSVSKVFNSDKCMESILDAIQVMGGDGVTKFYPLERLLQEAKINQIAGGTNEAVRLVIYRAGLRRMGDEWSMPHRVVHKELGVPVSMSGKPTKQREIDEDQLLKVLSEDYRVNPGLHMSRGDLKDHFDVDDKTLDGMLMALEQKKWVKLHRGRKGVELVKATYEGLKRANPLEYYQWYPAWVKKENIF
jgi:alkylation response protein AidB-like acyl-CoA dehydrogenase